MKQYLIFLVCVWLSGISNDNVSCREIEEPYVHCPYYGRCYFSNINEPGLDQFKNLLDSLKDSILKTLISVEIIDSHVPMLGSSVMRTLHNLHYFSATQIGLEIISKDAFNNMEQLENLELSRNILPNVKYAWLKNLSNLSHLYLDNNNISLVEWNAFYELKNLQVLHLEWNNIRNLDKKTFCNCKKISLLYLSHNKLISLELILPNNALKYMDVHDNKLWQLKIFSQEKLSEEFNVNLKLIANENNLKDVLVKNISVYHLNLMQNPVRSLAFLHNPAFKVLKHLWIPYIKNMTWTLSNLEFIHIPLAQIQTFPMHLSSNITLLDLDSNDIEYVNISDVLMTYPKLKFLYLRDNDLPCDKIRELINGFGKEEVKLFLNVGKSNENIHRRIYDWQLLHTQDETVVCLTELQRKQKHVKLLVKSN